MPSVLLHVCCGPCSLMPVLRLRQERFAVTACFFNHNIHPQEEYELRCQAMTKAADDLNVTLITIHPENGAVDPEAWLSALAETENTETLKTNKTVRCPKCFQIRLNATAEVAATHGYDFFCTSLLYSRYQNQEDIITAGKVAVRKTRIPFLQRDFRPWWHEGIKMSHELGLYRQKWCGCLLSKAEARR